MNIVIWSPGFTLRFGGVVALHRLCRLLRDRGARASIWTPPGHPFAPEDIYGNPHADGDVAAAVAIYPEVVNNNPIRAARVVRWLLNTPGVVTGHDGVRGDGQYGPEDLICHYAARFTTGFPHSEELYVFDLFSQWIYEPQFGSRPGPLPRHGTLLVRRKGAGRRRLPEIEQDVTELTEFQQEPPRFGIHARRHAAFYSYDTATWLSVQAVLCGCRSTVIPDDGLSAEAWRASHWLFRFGVNYGLGDTFGDETRHLVRPWIAECEQASFRTVDRLLDRLGHNPFAAEERRIAG